MRHESIKPLSKEHHHGLMLCSKLRKGMKKNVSTGRMEKYCKWFYSEHLAFHFEEEERFVFPILGMGHEHIKKAIEQHKRLTHLFNVPKYTIRTILEIETELESHIRFEERVLFNQIQKKATKHQFMEMASKIHDKELTDNTTDEFWQ